MGSGFSFEDFQDPQTLAVSTLSQYRKLTSRIEQLRERRDAVAPRNAAMAKQVNQQMVILEKERDRLGMALGRRLTVAKAPPRSAK